MFTENLSYPICDFINIRKKGNRLMSFSGFISRKRTLTTIDDTLDILSLESVILESIENMSF